VPAKSPAASVKPEQLATCAEVAELLGIPEATLTQWRYLRVGPDFIKVGRYVRYDWADVRRWLATRKTAAGGH
jgi:predicted DNA-binding transcriptional regulator AlpA